MSECCEIRDTSLGTWLSLPEGGLGAGGELKKSLSGSHPPGKRLLEQKFSLASFWEGQSETEGQGAHIIVSTGENRLIKHRLDRMWKVQSQLGREQEQSGLGLGSSGERETSMYYVPVAFTTLTSLPGSFLVLLIKKSRLAASSRSR